jgi:hypothetical protein
MLFLLPVSSSAKVNIVSRVTAKLIDLFFVFFVAALLPYPFGPLLGFTYSLFGDGMNFKIFHSQSIGKKLMKLQTISTVTKKPGTYKDSALRNTPVGIATFFGIIPIWGWLILGIIGVPLMMIEIYLMLVVDSGHRLGDVMADTEVVEFKE